MTQWPNITFSDSGQERLEEVQAFLDALQHQEHPLAQKAREEFTGV